MKVIKRNGNIVEYDGAKILKSIHKAIESSEEEITKRQERKMCDYFNMLQNDAFIERDRENDTITVEQLQNIVEEYLMRNNLFAAARNYIQYREEIKKVRFLKERIDYMSRYINTGSNAATSSETDANANVLIKNVANLNGEVYKVTNRLIQRQRMKEQLGLMYDAEIARNYINDLEHHILYAHDESSYPVPMPYTYSCKEVVEVMYNGKNLMLPLDLLYSLCDADETLVDEQNDVSVKYPWHMYVKDRDNKFVRVERITKKKRHRKLCRVKTAFGEDVVVTDNHPMIVNKDNVNDTVEAAECVGMEQYRCGVELSFKGMDTLDFVKILPTWVEYEDKFLKYQQSTMKRHITLDGVFGYVIGFFVGDGNYENTTKSLNFTQKDKSVLDVINGYIFDIFGISGKIYKDSAHEKYCLRITNKYVYELFRNYFKIQDKAQNKILPYNILEFNEEFAKGCLAGLVDSDGSVDDEKCSISIRLSSRACVMQCTALLRHFGYGVGNGMQSVPFGQNPSYHTNYTIWGVSATARGTSVPLDGSFKCREKLRSVKTSSLKYNPEGYCTVTSVDEIEENSAFLSQNEYIYDLTTETHTFTCNNILVHNCSAYSIYPLLLEGVGNMDGVTPTAPHNLDSFCGQTVNLVFLLASQVKGAVAIGGLFVAFNWYCIREWGDKFYEKRNESVYTDINHTQRTVEGQIVQYFQQIIWGINQPAGNRSAQSPFTNVSYYDKNYFAAMFGDFCYPDSTKPTWEQVDYLQRLFMKTLNKERLTSVIAFPVETMCLLSNGKDDIIDQDYKNFTAEMYAEGHSFFTYISDSPSALASCCRLRNEIDENVFSFTNGLSGLKTGSCNVITLNLNRIVQDFFRESGCEVSYENLMNDFKPYFLNILERVYKYHTAYKTILYNLEDKKMLNACNAGYIRMKDLYSTIGMNGINEAAMFLGIEVSYNERYVAFCRFITSTIKEQNRRHSNAMFKFNQEFVPAESLGVKNFDWDKEDGYWVPDDGRVLYNSYFYDAHDNTSVFDKIRLHGREMTETLDGGVGLHINLDEHLSAKQYLKIIDYIIKVGCSYFTFNIPNTKCDDCGFITKHNVAVCPKCGSENLTKYTRIIGYLRPTKAFGKGRMIEEKQRTYTKPDEFTAELA